MLARKRSHVGTAGPGGPLSAAGEAAEEPRASGAAPGSFRVRYSLGPLLGKGAFGTVYACTRRGEAQAQAGRRSLAVKMIPKKPSDGHTGAAAGRAEAQLMRQMAAHPASIVQLVEWLEDDSTVYLVMERCRGGDLHRIVQHCGRVAEPTACSILRQLATAVAHCHSHHVLHRDINTRNIFVASEIDLEGRTSSSDGAAAADGGGPVAGEASGEEDSAAAGEAEDASSDQGSASGAPLSPRSAGPSPGLSARGSLRHQQEAQEEHPPPHENVSGADGEAGAAAGPAPGLRGEQSRSERRHALRQMHRLLEQEQGEEGAPEAGQEGAVHPGTAPAWEPSEGLTRHASLGPGAVRGGKGPRGRDRATGGGGGSTHSPLAVMRKSLSTSSATSSSSSFTSFSSSASASSAAPHLSGMPSLLLGAHGARGYGSSSPGLERPQGRAVLAKLDEAAAYNWQALGAAPESDAREGTEDGLQGGVHRGATGEVQAGALGEEDRERGIGKGGGQDRGPESRLVSPLQPQLGAAARDSAPAPSTELVTREAPAPGAVFVSRRERQRGAFEGDIHIKLADFGLSKLLPPSKPYTRGMKGARSFRAPEVVKGHRYGVSADVWSMGVVFCVMLTGRAPFHGVTKEDHVGLRQSILRAKVDFAHPVWGGVSGRARELVRLLLEPDPRRRITAEAVAHHPLLCQGPPEPAAATPAAVVPRAPLVRTKSGGQGKGESREEGLGATRRSGRSGEEGDTPGRAGAGAGGTGALQDGKGGSLRLQARERGISSPHAASSGRGATAPDSTRGSSGGGSSGGSMNSASRFWGLLRPITPELGHSRDLPKSKSLRRNVSRGHAAQSSPGEEGQKAGQGGRARGHQSTLATQRQHPGAPSEWGASEVPKSSGETSRVPQQAAGVPGPQEDAAAPSQSGHVSVVTRDDLPEGENKGEARKKVDEEEEEVEGGGIAPVPSTSAAAMPGSSEGARTTELVNGTGPRPQSGSQEGEVKENGDGGKAAEEASSADEASSRVGSHGATSGESQVPPASAAVLATESGPSTGVPVAAPGEEPPLSSTLDEVASLPSTPAQAGPSGPQSPASSAASTSGPGGQGAPAAPKRKAKKSSVCEIVAEIEVAPPLYHRRTGAGGHSVSMVDASPQTSSMFGLGMTTPQGTHSGVHEETKLPMAYRRRTGPGTSFDVNTAPFPQASSVASTSVVHAQTKLPLAYQRRTGPGTPLGTANGLGAGSGLVEGSGGAGAGPAPRGSAEAPLGGDANGGRYPLAPRSNTVHARPSHADDARSEVLVGLSGGLPAAGIEHGSATPGAFQVPEGQLLTWNNDTAAYLWRKDSGRTPLSASLVQGSKGASFAQRREASFRRATGADKDTTPARGAGEASQETRTYLKSASAGSRNELRAPGAAPRRRERPQVGGSLSEVESSASRRSQEASKAPSRRRTKAGAEQGAAEAEEDARWGEGEAGARASGRAGVQAGARGRAPARQREGASARDAHPKASKPAGWASAFRSLSHSFSSKDPGRQRPAGAAVASSGAVPGQGKRSSSSRVVKDHGGGPAGTVPGKRSTGAGTSRSGMASSGPPVSSAALQASAGGGASEGVPTAPQRPGEEEAAAAGPPGLGSKERPSARLDPDWSSRVEQEGGIVAQVLQLGVKSQSEVLRPCSELDPALTRQASGAAPGGGRRSTGSSMGGSTGRRRSGRPSDNQQGSQDPGHLGLLEHAEGGAPWRGPREGEEWAGALPQGSLPEGSWGYASLSRKKGSQEAQGSHGSALLASLPLVRPPLVDGTSWASTSTRSSAGGARTGAPPREARTEEGGGRQRRGWAAASSQGGSLSGTPRAVGQSTSSVSTVESRDGRGTGRTRSLTKVKKVTSGFRTTLVSGYLLND